jgi:hypothetical protein
LAIQYANNAVAALGVERGLGDYEAYLWLMARVDAYKIAVSKWPPGEQQYITTAVNFFDRGTYRETDAMWERGATNGEGDGVASRIGVIPRPPEEGGAGTGIVTPFRLLSAPELRERAGVGVGIRGLSRGPGLRPTHQRLG